MSPSAVTAQWPNKCGYSVTTDGARLRTGPGSGYTTLGLLRKGDPVSGAQRRRDWDKVGLQGGSGARLGNRRSNGLKEGTTGWISKRLLQADTCMQLN
ncbi:SH3 domain-containing protein [Streptomyces sp. N35]|uniref:SH3 domain-containing protein n=1 Tax=Streptomyces sp. N35 TaxID=2795730 RepID=UPI0018F75397|nr:SH3 domain-containing protein [Streptomyces sp. N35]